MNTGANLSRILQKLYRESNRYDIAPPVRLIKILDTCSLVISDFELSDDDISVLCKFLKQPEVINHLSKLEVNIKSGGKASYYRKTSALKFDGWKLFKEITRFISRSKSLSEISFVSIVIPGEILYVIGKALSNTTSVIRWLSFKSCDIDGNNGLQVLTPFLCALSLQVLGIERCGLTDESIPYVASIIKAQQHRLDDLYWNATLRIDANSAKEHTGGAEALEEREERTNFVYSCGLVALSLYDNLFTGSGLRALTRVLRNNNWLLGLNLARNRLDQEAITTIVEELVHNKVIQVVLLKDNPGVDQQSVKILNSIIASNTTAVLPRLLNGFRRFSLLPHRVSQLLVTWVQLEQMESTAISSHGPPKPQADQFGYTVDHFLNEYSYSEVVRDNQSATLGEELRRLLEGSGGTDEVLLAGRAMGLTSPGGKPMRHSNRYSVDPAATTEKVVIEPFHQMSFPDTSLPGYWQDQVDATTGFATEESVYEDPDEDFIDRDRRQALQELKRRIRESPRGSLSRSRSSFPHSKGRSSQQNGRRSSADGQQLRYLMQNPNNPYFHINRAPLTPHPQYSDEPAVRNRVRKDFMLPTSVSESVFYKQNRKKSPSVTPRQSMVDRLVASSPAPWVPPSAPSAAAEKREKFTLGSTDRPTRMRARSAGGERGKSLERPSHALKKKSSRSRHSAPSHAWYEAQAVAEKEKLEQQRYVQQLVQEQQRRERDQEMSGLSNSVLSATKNLEQVTRRLKDVAETLSESMDLNLSLQRSTPTASPATLSATNSSSNVTPLRSSFKSSSLKKTRMISSDSTPPSSHHRVRGYGSSGASASTPVIEGPTDESAAEFSNSGVSKKSGVSDVISAGEEEELAQLIRSKMKEKLTSFFI